MTHSDGMFVLLQTESKGSLTLAEIVLVTGMTMRLTRLVVTDDLGQWWIKDPLFRRLFPDRQPEERTRVAVIEADSKKLAYFAGLDCPYCVGFHIGWMTIASYLLARKFGLLGVWKFVAGSLTLNEVAAHLNVLVGDV